jgi:hypothetical protein
LLCSAYVITDTFRLQTEHVRFHITTAQNHAPDATGAGAASKRIGAKKGWTTWRWALIKTRRLVSATPTATTTVTLRPRYSYRGPFLPCLIYDFALLPRYPTLRHYVFSCFIEVYVSSPLEHFFHHYTTPLFWDVILLYQYCNSFSMKHQIPRTIFHHGEKSSSNVSP